MFIEMFAQLTKATSPETRTDHWSSNIAKAHEVVARNHHNRRVARYQPAMEGKGFLTVLQIGALTGVDRFITRQQIVRLLRDGLVDKREGRPARYKWKGLE